MLHTFTVYLSVSSPSSLSVDADVDVVPEVDAAQEPDDAADDLALAVEQTGKHPHFDNSDIAYSFSLMLALEIAAATVYPISDA